jgi:hypothetical protein
MAKVEADEGDALTPDADHRRLSVVELALHDLKERDSTRSADGQTPGRAVFGSVFADCFTNTAHRRLDEPTRDSV